MKTFDEEVTRNEPEKQLPEETEVSLKLNADPDKTADKTCNRLQPFLLPIPISNCCSKDCGIGKCSKQQLPCKE
ncbi:MAG: hypothetical protein H7Y86_15215 [Rhizobacter sp.]|nr:hypothetical protein [Ferruginibacter sp.]